MTEDGVNGLSLSEVARRLGVKPPSLYKYFDSLMDVFDALFAPRPAGPPRGPPHPGWTGEEPGLPALAAGLDAACRWAFANPALAQLLFWRPVPSFEPTAEAMAPSVEMVRLQRQALADAAAAGQLGAGADSDEALYVVSVFVSGVLGQAMANEPARALGQGPLHAAAAQAPRRAHGDVPATRCPVEEHHMDRHGVLAVLATAP